MKKILCMCFLVALAVGNVFAQGSGEAAGAAGDGTTKTVVMIVKQSDPWFDDMALGIEQLKKDTGMNVYVQVPASGDPSLQISIMENLIAQNVDAICIVPNDPKSLIPTIKKARDAGIIVVTHEAPDIAEYVDLDIEAFKGEEFGALFGEALGKALGGKGQYAGFVGGLTMTTHMEWYAAATQKIASDYPGMQNISKEPYEDSNSIDTAYSKTVEILKAYPNIKGFFDCSAHGVGISQALKDKGRTDLKVVSLAVPSMSSNYIKDGSMSTGFAWRPADAGYATAAAALMLINQETIETGTDLHATGYENVTREGNIAYGFAPLEFTPENVDNYNF
ncbi:autoinducer 2 ABC transporter substrate-binding protein [Sediminispirochaeta bajacaliforniensis]|uniref:autoinducer 2 ABC transporter substrate-binding protein n=1 Tax=Sediminispirochaeta bajacaliforniensis TaxID=148 RepID=UPI000376DD81|nr:autoinducer 2 ABC transporter substrate-binding protein [Sediminispirochaeta bajacaliforniensis]